MRSTGRALQQITEDLDRNPERILAPEEVYHLVVKEFPTELDEPEFKILEESILQDGNDTDGYYKVGQWVERLGNDMQWHLEPIRRISKKLRLQREHTLLKLRRQDSSRHPGADQFSKESDKGSVLFYTTNAGILCPMENIRASRSGLVRHFGARPLLFQQYALFRIEEDIRFQANHENDFQVIDFEVLANDLWETWLNDDRNEDFRKLYETKPECAQNKLKDHIFQPFRLMKQIARDWNFKDEDISIYQYNSILGSGYLLTFIVLAIQLIVPIIIFFYAVRESNRFPNFLNSANILNYEQGNVGGVNNGNTPGGINVTFPPIHTWDYNTIFETSWDRFCLVPSSIDELLTKIVILIVYLVRVIPKVMDTFYATAGENDNVRSKINAIRLLSWLQGDDTAFQRIGLKIDRYMNSFYIAAVYLLMLFVLFLTISTANIVLNALAIEFVIAFDEEIVRSLWYDPTRRYIRAGAIEMLFRGELLLEPFDLWETCCDYYDIDKAAYISQIGKVPIRDPAVAKQDATDLLLQSAKAKLWAALAKASRKKNNPEARWQYEEPSAHFGIFDRLVTRQSGGLFNRYGDYHTWSRWDHLLWLPRIPRENELSNFVTSPHWKATFSEFMNYDKESHHGSTLRILNVLRSTLCCRSIKHMVQIGVRREPGAIPFYFLDGLFEVFAYSFVVIFSPAVLVFYTVMIILCEPLT